VEFAEVLDWMGEYYKGNDYVADLLVKRCHEELGYGVPLCKRGCSHCCYHFFEITTAEYHAALMYFVKTYGEKASKDLMTRSIKNQLQEILEIKTLYYKDDEEVKSGFNNERFSSFTTEYHKRKIPCMFLGKKGECLVYEFRPTWCRLYFNFVNVDLCRPENVEDGLTKLKKGIIGFGNMVTEMRENIIKDLVRAHERFGLEAKFRHPLLHFYAGYKRSKELKKTKRK